MFELIDDTPEFLTLSRGAEEAPTMISKPSRTWAMLSRTLDALLESLSDDDIADLHGRIETERTRRFIESRQPRHCVDCGFLKSRCQCDTDGVLDG